jgi:hypothetical protein
MVYRIISYENELKTHNLLTLSPGPWEAKTAVESV